MTIITQHGSSSMTMIAALYVETNGHYFGVEGVDPWDIARDARNYEGPWPVVAHPPCHLWVNFAALNFKRYGGEHNRPGNDGGCFGSALNSVRRWGGVLEHPAHSNAWKHFSLMAPKGIGWTRAGEREWVCEVWQSAYGHKARKRTWLYYVGDAAPLELDWTRKAGTAQCGWFDRIKPTLSKKEASRTPIDFRNTLIFLARWSRGGGQMVAKSDEKRTWPCPFSGCEESAPFGECCPAHTEDHDCRNPMCVEAFDCPGHE